MPNSTSRCRTNRSSSTNEPGSRSFSIRSRARSFPCSRCRSTCRSLAWSRACSLSSSSQRSFACVVSWISDTARSLTGTLGTGDSFAAMGTTPIDRSTTWPYEEGEAGAFTYSRFSSPTVAEAERALGALDGGAALLFASGTAACTSVVLALLSPGQTVALAEGAYYGTGVLLAELARWGLRTVEFDQTGAPPKDVDLVWLEAPSNPFLTMPDFEAAAAHPARVVCDSTAATPLNVRPLELGCDVALHSATKYLAGHDDALAGAAICKDPADAARLLEFRSRTGPVAAADTAWVVLRGLATLEVRL